MLRSGRFAVVAAAAAAMVALSAGAAVAGPAMARPASPQAVTSTAVHSRPHAARVLLPVAHGPWAGYTADNPGGAVVFHTVSAEFKVPPLNCTLIPPGEAIQGVGIDGPKKLVAAGVEGSCPGGVATDMAGWQMPGHGIVPSPFNPVLAVATGDVVRATVTYDLHLKYTLAVDDLTSGAGFAIVQKCMVGCDNAYADVITQADPPHVRNHGVLADFAKVTFDNIQVNDYGAAACRVAGPLIRPHCWQAVADTMVVVLVPRIHFATPGPYNLGLNQFGNVWHF